MQGKEKTITIITLAAVGLLTGLHFAFAGQGNQYYNSKYFDQHVAFIVVAAIAQFAICIILFVDMFKQCMRKMVKPYLIIGLLVLEFAIAVDIAILTAQAGIAKSQLGRLGASNRILDTLYGIGVADSVISWVLKIPALVIVTYFTVEGSVHGVPTDAPPPVK